MKTAICVLGAALSLAAQPKLPINAKLDTRSASSGVERAVRELTAAQPQPAWIGYDIASVRSWNLGCEYVYQSDGQSAHGVVHLEPPDHAIILIRVDENAISRIRYVSPDCEIDGGGAPLHWLTDVQPAQSVAMLAALAAGHDPGSANAVGAIAMHSDASADAALEKFLAPDMPESLRLRVVNWFGDRGHHGFDVLKGLVANERDERVRDRAVSALASSKDPQALPLLIEIARKNPNPKLRAQAVGDLGRKSGSNVLATLKDAANDDPDPTVQRRAVSTLISMPDGQGVPVLIEMAENQKNLTLRKQAMNSLQNSRDPRALEFFEKVLK